MKQKKQIEKQKRGGKIGDALGGKEPNPLCKELGSKYTTMRLG
jgi:hypothetical protein